MCVKLYYLGRANVFSSVATDFGSWNIEGNISLEEINLPRPEAIITFNLLGNHSISLLCM